MRRAVRVLVADDHPFMRATLTATVNADPRLEVAGVAATVAEAVELARLLTPDVVVVDGRMPVGGAARAAAALRRLPGPPQVIALGAIRDAAALEIVRAGACCFVVKERAADVVSAIVWATEHADEALPELASLDRFRAARR